MAFENVLIKETRTSTWQSRGKELLAESRVIGGSFINSVIIVGD